MSLRTEVRKLRKIARERSETEVDALLRRMRLRWEVEAVPKLNAARERMHEVDCRLAEEQGEEAPDPPAAVRLSAEAEAFAETDTPEQAAADQRHFDMLRRAGAVTDLVARAGKAAPTPGFHLRQIIGDLPEDEQHQGGPPR